MCTHRPPPEDPVELEPRLAMVLSLALSTAFLLVVLMWATDDYEPSPHLPDTLGGTP